MELIEFKATLAAQVPPQGLAHGLAALWWDAKGDWSQAHGCAQADEGKSGAWVHAYLHRKEGDHPNAAYWYRRAGKAVATTSLAAEWEVIASVLLKAF